MDLNMFLLLVFCLLTVMVGFMVPVLIQLMKMIRSLRMLVEDTDSSMKPLLSEINETIKRVNSIAGTVDESVKGMRNVFSFFGSVVKTAAGFIKKGEQSG